MTPRLPIYSLFDVVQKRDYVGPNVNEFVIWEITSGASTRFSLIHTSGTFSVSAAPKEVKLLRPATDEELKNHPNLRIRELYQQLQAGFDPFDL